MGPGCAMVCSVRRLGQLTCHDQARHLSANSRPTSGLGLMGFEGVAERTQNLHAHGYGACLWLAMTARGFPPRDERVEWRAPPRLERGTPGLKSDPRST